jgi:hypothetical protein
VARWLWCSSKDGDGECWVEVCIRLAWSLEEDGFLDFCLSLSAVRGLRSISVIISPKQYEKGLQQLRNVSLRPPHPDRSRNILLPFNNDNTLLQHLAPTLISQLVHQPPDLRHSFSPSLTPYCLQFIRRERASDFGRAESLWWMAVGEEGCEVGVYG